MADLTPRERLLAPLRQLTPDRPCWTADLTWWYGATQQAGRLDARYEGPAGILRLHEDLGVCDYYHYGASVFSTHQDGVEVVDRVDGDRRERRWRTPAGELSERWEYLPASYCWAHTAYAAKTAADLAVVQDIFQRTRHTPNAAGFLERDAYLGDAGVPIAAVPRSPLPALLADWCGIMGTIYLVADEPAAVEDTLAVIDQANDAAFDALVAGPAELVHFCDNLDSNNCASYWSAYLGNYYDRRLRQLHAAGKVAAVHLDGTVRGLLPKLAACGFDAVESVTPGPVGDVEIEDLRAVAGSDTVTLWGGVPGAMFAAPWTAADLRAHVRRLLDALWPGRLIVASADQVPPDGDVSLCRVVAETIAEYCP